MAFKVTPQHAAFFDWIADPLPAKRSAILEAVAGSGKTSTLREAAARIPKDQPVVYLAFNKKAVEEVQSRGLPSHVSAMTLNSLGHRAILKAFGRVTLDTQKTSILVDKLLGKGSPQARMFGATIGKLVSKAKTIGLVPSGVEGAHGLVQDTRASWEEMIVHFDIDPPCDDDSLMGRAIDFAREVLADGLRDLRMIDFDDQLYATVVLRLPLPRYPWVMVDEAQDVSHVQRVMLAGCLDREGGRLIAVGDRHQAIYGFRGAAHDSLDQIAEEFGCESFPLTVTYRCPRNVVATAQQFVPHLEAWEGAADGEVGIVADLAKHRWLPTDLVVCRNNAPLITLAYQLLRARVPCRVLGREIGTGLAALIKKLKPTSIPNLIDKLAAYEKREMERLQRLGREGKIEALNDKCETLRTFALEVRGLDELDRAIAEMFDDRSGGRVTLSTIHKAKGSEAPTVIILDPWRLPSKAARQAWVLQQERNLAYVAITRAGERLLYASLASLPTPIRKF